jgi:hypothetical protein
MSFLTDQTKTVNSAFAQLKELVTRNTPKHITVPLSTVEECNPESIELVRGEWTPAPWAGMRCMLTHCDEVTKSKYVLCEVMEPMDLGAHRHPRHVEEIMMIEGCMDDQIVGQRTYPGTRYKIPMGEPHWPVFPGPCLFMVIFRDGPVTIPVQEPVDSSKFAATRTEPVLSLQVLPELHHRQFPAQ